MKGASSTPKKQWIEKIHAAHKPLLMGVINCTPDSYHRPSQSMDVSNTLERVAHMVADGVDIVDIGGESTRPFAQEISPQEECDRVLGAIDAIISRFDVPVSIDSRKAFVIEEALKAGAVMVNDVSALGDPKTLPLVVKHQVPICIMHSQGSPSTMQINPQYEHIIEEVFTFLKMKRDRCLAQGLAKENIILDPGFGFGKSIHADNFELLSHLDQFKALSCPILVGFSRKSMFGQLFNIPSEQRLAASLGASVIAYQKGARIIRTHDVLPTFQALKVAEVVMETQLTRNLAHA